MSTGTWQPGFLYIPGSLVRPRTAPPVVQSAPTNADFEAGASGWSLPAGYTIGQHGHAFNGTWSLEADNTAAVGFTNNNLVPVKPGQTIRATAMVNHGDSGSGDAGGAVIIAWFSAAMAFISSSDGNQIRKGSTDVWYASNVTGVAPPGAAFAAIGGFMYTTNDPIWMDQFSWDYTYAETPAGLIYKAVQAASGFSGSAEPTWPTVVGNTVVDNDVTWEAVLTSRVVYEAHPILKSDTTEPDFPLEIGGTVVDGTILWEATSRQITDTRCPHSKYVITGASKIFAGDKDIIPFCATNNPLDWSTPDDAGFLPFGLQKFGGSPVLGLGLYRSNLVAFNEQGAQMWQIDEDPQNMALLDAVPVGCRYHRTIQPVSNDLGFLTDVGIRNFGIAAASTNLQAGDFAKPLDPLVKASIATGIEPIGVYYPGTGQYLVFFGADAYVLTFNGTGARAVSRSRYQFAGPIDDWTMLDGVLYLRSGDKVWRLDEEALQDDVQPTLMDESDWSYSPPTAVWTGSLWELDMGLENVANISYSGASLPSSLRFAWEIVDASHGNSSFFYRFAVDAMYSSVVLGAAPGSGLIDLETPEGATHFDFFVSRQFGGTDGLVTIAPFAPAGEDFEGYIAWQYLDLAAFGDDVMMHGFDLVGEGEVAVSFGWNQSNEAHATTPYTVQAETLNGMPIAMPIKAPSVQMRLTFAANQHWKWQAARIYDSPVNT